MKNILFTGASTALITPFSDGRIDTDSFGRIIDLQLGAKIPALTVGGTTLSFSTFVPVLIATICIARPPRT